MTQAKIQTFCKNYNLSLSACSAKQRSILPRSVTQRIKCLYIHISHFSVIKKKNWSTFPDAIKELEENFNYESNEISDVVLGQVEKNKFPIPNDKNCMFAVFAFDLEICMVENQIYCEA